MNNVLLSSIGSPARSPPRAAACALRLRGRSLARRACAEGHSPAPCALLHSAAAGIRPPRAVPSGGTLPQPGRRRLAPDPLLCAALVGGSRLPFGSALRARPPPFFATSRPSLAARRCACAARPLGAAPPAPLVPLAPPPPRFFRSASCAALCASAGARCARLGFALPSRCCGLLRCALSPLRCSGAALPSVAALARFPFGAPAAPRLVVSCRSAVPACGFGGGGRSLARAARRFAPRFSRLRPRSFFMLGLAPCATSGGVSPLRPPAPPPPLGLRGAQGWFGGLSLFRCSASPCRVSDAHGIQGDGLGSPENTS